MAIYKICFYVPTTHADQVKNALFAAGAGKVGAYSHCCWQVLGQGQFMPLPGSDAYSGTINTLSTVDEYKIEMICEKALIRTTIDALKQAHPYEEPAYQVTQLEDF